MARKTPPSANGDAVGYGKPPRHSQFKPGQSGNPRGRRKGSRGLKTDLQQELGAAHTIQINGQPITGTRQQLMVKTLTTRAAMGDLKATTLLIPLVLQVFGIEDRGTGPERLSVTDQALLDFLLGPLSSDALPRFDAAAMDGNENTADHEPFAGRRDGGDDGEPRHD